MYQDDDIGYVVEDDNYDEINFDDNSDNHGHNHEFNDNYDNLNYEEVPQENGLNKWIIIILSIVLIVLLVLLFMSCEKKGVIPNINIVDDKVYVKLSNTLNIPIKLENTDNSNIEWQSIDEEIANVDNNGNVKGVSLGRTNILATYVHSNYQNYSDECEVYVYQGDKEVSLIDIAVDETIKIKKGNMANINITYNPTNAFVYSIKYDSNNTDVVSVLNGMLTANNVGEATITVIVNEVVSKTINVLVYDESDEDNSNNNVIQNTVPTSVKFNDDEISVMVNVEKNLLYSVSPSSAKNYNVTFENSNNTVLKVDNNGKIKGISVGKSTVTIKVNGTLTDTIVVNVEPYVVLVDKLTLKSSSNLTLSVGGTSKIQYEITPSDASNKVVTFISSNESIASVDENGLIKAVGSGNCVITIKSVDGNKEVKVNVNVN